MVDVAGECPRGAEEVATTAGDERLDTLHAYLLSLTTLQGWREVVILRVLGNLVRCSTRATRDRLLAHADGEEEVGVDALLA